MRLPNAWFKMKKVQNFKKKRIRIVAIIILGIVVSSAFLNNSCDSRLDVFNTEEEPDPSCVEADSIFAILTDAYNHNPDSAIILASELELRFENDCNNRDLVRLYTFMSELYQYRKDNPDLALEYLTKALDLTAKNSEIKFDQTFLYINVGNIMYSYQLYNEAIYIYRQIPKITDLKDRPEVMALIYNNIALSFQMSGSEDSARIYFEKTRPFIEKTTSRRIILSIQYYNYLSALAYQIGDLDSIPIYFDKANMLFGGMEKVLKDYPCEYSAQLWVDTRLDFYNNKIKAWDWMAAYYLDLKQIDSAIIMFEEALSFTRVTDDCMWCPQLYSNLSKSYFAIEDYNLALQYLDSSIYYLQTKYVNYKELELAFRSKAEIFDRQGGIDKVDKNIAIADRYRDTLLTKKSSEDLMVMKIELAVKPVQLAMKNVEISRNEKVQTIENQNLLIKMLVSALLLIAIALFVYYRLYLNLKKTRFQLAQKTIENINTKRSETTTGKLKDSVEHDLLQKIESELVNKKAYLESNISLQLIADRLNTNRSYISKIINSVYKMNFNDYINKLRINEACNIICNNTDPNFTIDHLYSEVGFVGKSTFYTAFKKYTGVTPAVFFKMNNQA